MTLPLGSTSASVPAVASPTVTEADALKTYLAEGSTSTSFLAAAIRDARSAVSTVPCEPPRPPALWLGTLGYLIAVEQLGKAVCLRAAPRGSLGDKASFLAACKDFGEASVDEPQHRTLYDVRCALAHQYSLTGNRRRFAYTNKPDGPMIDRTAASVAAKVNLRHVWRFVEEMVERVRTLNAAGDVMILNGLSPQVVHELRFDVNP
jgi:hypothetical protein